MLNLTPSNVPDPVMAAPILNTSTYKFVELPTELLPQLRQSIYEQCQKNALKGTVILATEGINAFLAGTPDNIKQFFAFLQTYDFFHDVAPKESFSSDVPFNRLIVKIKPEIITMRQSAIRPQDQRASAVDASTLKRWLDQGQDDDGRPVVMLDTRNTFEVEIGTFNHALHFNLKKFTDFLPQLEAHKKNLEDKTVVSFCTGGIRCEKAAIVMQQVGLDHVYQLDGGILKYFEEVGGAHYQGDCFVFDDRTALSHDLQPSTQVQCYGCRAVLNQEDQASPLYQPPVQCPQCFEEKNHLKAQKQARIAQKNAEKMAQRQAYCQAQKAIHQNGHTSA